MNKKNKGFTTIELITSFTLASVIMIILFNIILILKDNLSKVNAKTNMLVEKDNLSYNINKRFKEKEISSITMCDEGDKCYLFTYSDDTSDKLVYSNTDKTITFNNYTFDIIDGITVEEPTITEHYDTMSSTKYNGYFIIHIPIKIDNKDYSIKINKHFNTNSLVIDLTNYLYDKQNNKFKPVEYIQSVNSQYIDLLYSPNNHTSIEVDGILHGSGSMLGVNSYFVITSAGGYYRFKYGSQIIDTSKMASTRSIIKLNEVGVYVNDTSIGNWSENVFSSPYTMLLFARRSSSGTIEEKSKTTIYYLKIYDNDTLVRDYIPVIDSTDRPCMFDKIGRECYYNQGTGEFLYG